MPRVRREAEAERSDDATVCHRRREYARSFVRNVTGRDDVTIEADLADQIAYVLCRDEEIETSVRDDWGNWEYRFSQRSMDGKKAVPWLDEMVLGCVTKSPLSSENEPLWPDGRRFAICLTHDVDGVSSRSHEKKFVRRLKRVLHAQGPKRIAALQAAGSLYRIATGIGKSDQVGRFDEWLKIESEYGFHSTWYFLPSEYRRPHVYDMDYQYDDRVLFGGRQMPVSDMMKAIHDMGGDVGVHGSYLSACDSALLADQVAQVQRAVGQPVQSIRQHFLRYNAAITPAVQTRAGCQNDSTQGFNSSVGCRAGTSFPFRAWDHQVGAPSGVLEIPMHIMDVALLRTAKNDPNEARRIAIEFMDRVARVGGCLTLNWHPNLIPHPHYFRLYQALLREAAERNAWGCSASELTAWWNDREERLKRNPQQSN